MTTYKKLKFQQNNTIILYLITLNSQLVKTKFSHFVKKIVFKCRDLFISQKEILLFLLFGNKLIKSFYLMFV